MQPVPSQVFQKQDREPSGLSPNRGSTCSCMEFTGDVHCTRSLPSSDTSPSSLRKILPETTTGEGSTSSVDAHRRWISPTGAILSLRLPRPFIAWYCSRERDLTTESRTNGRSPASTSSPSWSPSPPPMSPSSLLPW